MNARQSTGVEGLDPLLGGGLLPGTLTVVVGATGAGKTQLGLQYCHAGRQQENAAGVILDVSARGDSQSHAPYAERMFGWEMAVDEPKPPGDLSRFYAADAAPGDYLRLFDHQGRRVTRQDLDWDQWRDWQIALNQRLQAGIAFLYGNFCRGRRRLVVDGVEPVTRPHESIQLNLFDYVYHQIVRKDPEWVARDLFRQQYRAHAEQAARHSYPSDAIGCMLLYTSQEVMLDELIARPLDEGDALSNANTLIYMGKIREGNRIGRGLYVAKHRGSACADHIIPYTIGDAGLRVG
jgi:KaiC/GvpD/RAD55 family RecA-like ATPase